MNKSIMSLVILGAISTPAIAEMNSHDHMSSEMGMEHNAMSMPSVSAVGMPANGAQPDKVIPVVLSDDMTIQFKSSTPIKPGDIVQFAIMNKGKQSHEFSIGSPKEQADYRAMLSSMPNHHKTDGSSVVVKPGQAQRMLWHFHGTTTVEFDCNMSGHYGKGMTKTLVL
ncbi:cupredoxin domain-containing protein [Vibrio nitrifigilis]|uniref:Copper-binding protein n=1 Tax=Vibrio nitrifigilis TaxID=2789781 RepID=A0ABS0GD02_9VIBR|nr:copper-binding protein [Vibrio nitrifigilis]MBF9000296.1 copper-binding protein [Vibrio nitrifigilis]